VSAGRLGTGLVLLVLLVLVNAPLLASDEPGTGPVVATLVADAVLLVLAWSLLRGGGRGRRRPSLQAVALGDLRPTAEGVLLERVQSEDYRVRGEVVEVRPDAVVLDLGNRYLEVLLDGHANPVTTGRAVELEARMIG
jgi:hypothetical protein